MFIYVNFKNLIFGIYISRNVFNFYSNRLKISYVRSFENRGGIYSFFLLSLGINW